MASNLQTYPIEHVCPALEGDALEDREHGLAEVVEAGDAPLWTLSKRKKIRDDKKELW